MQRGRQCAKWLYCYVWWQQSFPTTLFYWNHLTKFHARLNINVPKPTKHFNFNLLFLKHTLVAKLSTVSSKNWLDSTDWWIWWNSLNYQIVQLVSCDHGWIIIGSITNCMTIPTCLYSVQAVELTLWLPLSDRDIRRQYFPFVVSPSPQRTSLGHPILRKRCRRLLTCLLTF